MLPTTTDPYTGLWCALSPLVLCVQVKDQIWEQGNVALRTSFETGMPVRVIRGSRVNKKLQYSYEGLYRVKEHKFEVRTKSGQGNTRTLVHYVSLLFCS